MKLHDIAPQSGSKRRKRRVGRGISAGQGASCGFGMRGQKSRSGTGTKPGFEGGQMPLYRRVPKLKHFPLVKKQYTIINVGQLASLPANTEVTLTSLIENGVVTTGKHPLKVLGHGDISVALNIKAAAFTKSAKDKIKSAGGSCILSNQELEKKSTNAKAKEINQGNYVKNIGRNYIEGNIKYVRKDLINASTVKNSIKPSNKIIMPMIKTPLVEGYKSFSFNKKYRNADDEIMIDFQELNTSSSIEDIAKNYIEYFLEGIKHIAPHNPDLSNFKNYHFMHSETTITSFSKNNLVQFSQTLILIYSQFYLKIEIKIVQKNGNGISEMKSKT